MSIHDLVYKAGCIEVAEMCLKRKNVEPLSLNERDLFLGVLSTYFPYLFQGGNMKVKYPLSSKLMTQLLHFAKQSEWPEGFLQSFWLDVISRPFLEDITDSYRKARYDVWDALFSVSLGDGQTRRTCF